MSECCEVSNTNRSAEHCPECKSRGKSVGLLTLKSLLVPHALEQLETSLSYFFCGTSECTVVYFNERNVFRQDDIKVPVYQKNESEHTPVCYCFGWTRSRLKAGQTRDAIERIQMHIKAGRCGCEVHNPQGSCCLANVIQFVKTLNNES